MQRHGSSVKVEIAAPYAYDAGNFCRKAGNAECSKMSTISAILHGMHLTGGIFLEADLTAPWAIRSRVTPEDCSLFMQKPRHIIAYHLVTVGRCILILEDGRATQLEYGDIVILPRNTPHILCSAASVAAVSANDFIQLDIKTRRAHIVYGHGGERTQLLCGFLGSVTEQMAVLALLPDVLKLGADDWPAARWIESTFRYAIQEFNSPVSMSGETVVRLTELLFSVAVRRYLALHPQSFGAVEAAVRDAFVGRALVLLHNRMCEPWTTSLLAREVGLSRSAFADRFTRALGKPPMQYLACLRLQQASLRLLESSADITRIAYESGYESHSAFNKAFRRMYGAPPAAWRRARRCRPDSC